ncbi:senecionine N-oxygenase-like [Latimeria chalumnae]|uniref:Flavin-containing monooxygenase n=1 Tax=Latimeria chalumnae TaxID=7897 RepID=H2ZWR6_LATCH|nr:PREDICTED: senecionine N-oxygenase-like [Latimeria chalumnae]|eukprot:XP_006005513.1 PREDICTED: senecionine N-oxygenase-like [Latimeria chalumnae]
MSLRKFQVAVIGAGAAGLCAARHLLSRGEYFAPPVVYELSNSVGGTWVYTDDVGTDQHGLPVHSSMYRDLRSNLPKEVMAFPGFPFDSQLPSFVHHSKVKQYLDQYADHYGVREHIKFQTLVELVKPVVGDDKERRVTWEVTSRNLSSMGPSETNIFNAVLVCTGHYSQPHIPVIPGIKEFKGDVMHSHEYRTPEPFSGKRVVLNGAGPSGVDISLELSRIAKVVILSHSLKPLSCPLPDNVIQAPDVECFSQSGVIFQDGTEHPADTFMFCTGYNYSFPFLSQEVGLKVEDSVLSPLYQHIVHTRFPTLAFIGMCRTVCPFPHFNCQVLFFLSVLDGTFRLPSTEEMDTATREELQSHLRSGALPRHFHKLDSLQWDYAENLARMGKFDSLPPIIREIFDSCRSYRISNLLNFRSYRYEITGNNEWRMVPGEQE